MATRPENVGILAMEFYVPKRCLPQTAINSYYVGRDGNDWWPGHFRVHVPGNQRVKLVKLRLISWLFAPLLMC